VIPLEPHLLVRAASVYLAVVLTGIVWAWRRPASRAMAGALLASLWNLPVVLALHLVAMRAGWWSFDAAGGLLLGMPVDLYLSWIWLWGTVPALAFPSAPLAAVIALGLATDVVLMPAAAPLLHLGSGWLVGETVWLAFGLLPGQLLARWTARDAQLIARAVLQVAAFSGLLLFVLPAMIIAGSTSTWRNPLTLPLWQLSLVAQLLALPAVIGLSAVQEFVTRGGGTPVPFDPPTTIVTTGVYAYVRNPMQLSAVVLLFVLGLVLRNAWVAAAGIMAHIYSAGLAGWDEEADLRARFGDEWIAYRRGVRAWIPRLRPWQAPDSPPARLFVAASCGMCTEVGGWFASRSVRGLVIVPAEMHPSRALRRVTYESGDGRDVVSGVAAIGRALEHIHVGWALPGMVMRLPIVRPLIQLLVDASGGEPRTLTAGSASSAPPD
jgi:protein-S-isoprenylcysteine O-methyltransferase Ste14